MTIEQRVEFLTQSIESHDRLPGEMAERMDRTDRRFAEFVTRIDQLAERVDRFIEVTQLNFDRLTKAMIGLTEHASEHHRRLERLENQAS